MRDCDNCARCGRDGCKSWDCDFVPRKEAIEAWKEKHETADRPQGEWIEHKGRTIVRDNNFIDFFPTEYECSNCGLRQATYFINSTLPNFCPNCGARLKGADDDNA